LILRHQSTAHIDFQTAPWQDAILVTPQHAVHNQWNCSSIQKICQPQQQPLFVCPALDTIKDCKLTIAEQCTLEMHQGRLGGKEGTTEDLLHENKLVKGMKVMVMDSIETDLDLANNVQGEIVDIMHPAEPELDFMKSII